LTNANQKSLGHEFIIAGEPEAFIHLSASNAFKGKDYTQTISIETQFLFPVLKRMNLL
jgi:hypothetical protein